MEKSSVYEALGGIIRRERVERDINQAELARRVGLSRTSITNVELGRQGIAVHQLFDFANALGVEVTRLLPEHVCKDAEEPEPVPDSVFEWVESLKTKSVRL